MEFSNSVLAQVNDNLNSANMIYVNDIDTRAVENERLVGFICSTANPVRFVGIRDFGCHGDIFEEYRKHLGVQSLDYVYDSHTAVTPNVDISDEATSSRPYISNTDNFIIFQGITADVELTGGIFDPDIEMDFGPEVTFNHYTIVEPTRIVANVTASTSNQDPTPLVVRRGNVLSYGNAPFVSVTDVVVGQGPSGTFTTDFSSGGIGASALGPLWEGEVFGTVDSLDSFFKTSNAGTPSSNTGPLSGTSGYYLFTEKSGNNNGAGQYGQITTANFKDLTSISFDYHMFGANIGAISLYAQDMSGVWIGVWTKSGAQQSNQSDPFINSGVLDAISWEAKALRFVFEDGGGWGGDIAIDNIVITSV